MVAYVSGKEVVENERDSDNVRRVTQSRAWSLGPRGARIVPRRRSLWAREGLG